MRHSYFIKKLGKHAIFGMAIGLIFSVASQGQYYYQDFDIGAHDLKTLGFSGAGWYTDSLNGNWFMKTTPNSGLFRFCTVKEKT